MFGTWLCNQLKRLKGLIWVGWLPCAELSDDDDAGVMSYITESKVTLVPPYHEGGRLGHKYGN